MQYHLNCCAARLVNKLTDYRNNIAQFAIYVINKFMRNSLKQITEIIIKCGYKGKYVSLLKSFNLWDEILNCTSTMQNLNDNERVYHYLNPSTSIVCNNNNSKKYLGLTRGYNKYCSVKNCDYCKKLKSTEVKNAVINKYGVDNVGKLPNAVASRAKFWNDTDAVDLAKSKRKNTNLAKYGSENVFQNNNVKQKSLQTLLCNYGVDNPSKSIEISNKKRDTLFENYGVEHPLLSDVLKEKVKNTNMFRYGVAYPSQNTDIKNKIIETKIRRGSFNKSNASYEATRFFRNYCVSQGYKLDQVAFADIDNGLHEWGYFFDKWYLYDFVAFENGFRGNDQKILEIVEYHGPFHYTIEDAINRGSEKAVPWKSNQLTIAESVENDRKKEFYTKQYLTNNYKIIWATKWHKQ